MDLIIVGRPNVGKTLLMINFAAYLGLRELRVEVPDEDGVSRTERLSLDKARRQLVSLYAPKTTSVQAVPVDVALGRQRLRVMVLDTPGMTEGIRDQPDERRQTALTLERLMTASLIFHVIDAPAIRTRRQEPLGALDTALVEFGRKMDSYLVVANKMDRPGGHDGLKRFRESHRGVTVVPVSCLTRRGFRELKNWLMRTLA